MFGAPPTLPCSARRRKYDSEQLHAPPELGSVGSHTDTGTGTGRSLRPTAAAHPLAIPPASRGCSDRAYWTLHFHQREQGAICARERWLVRVEDSVDGGGGGQVQHVSSRARVHWVTRRGVGVFADGRRLGVLALLGNDQQGRPEIVVSLSEGDVLTDPSNGFPDDVYYIALARFFAPNGGFNYIVYVDGRRVAAVTTRVAATGSQAQVLYLGTRAPSTEVGMGFPRGPVDCDFNFFQVFEQGNRDARRDSSGLNFFDDSLIMFYDFPKQPRLRVMVHALAPPFPIQKLDVSAYGTAHQKARWTQHLVTLAAKSLAPLVWLHSKEQHFPCSAEWYLSRSRIVRTTVLDPGEISPPDRLQ